MYLPDHFRVEEPEPLLALIREHPLGLVICRDAEGLSVDPLPFLAAEGEPVRLFAHMARANPLWERIAAGEGSVTIVFQGGGHYISPGWYPSKKEHGRVVPTWNYRIVEVQGRARVHEDAGWLRAQVEALTVRHEAGRAEPWAVADAPEPYIAAQLRAIVGLEVLVTGMSGKFKLSQNRARADRQGVEAALREEGMSGLADHMAALEQDRTRG